MIREAYFVFTDPETSEEKIMSKMKIYDGQHLYKIHMLTKRVELVELNYEKSRVDFDKDYHYVAALSQLRALKKYQKFVEDEIDRQQRLN